MAKTSVYRAIYSTFWTGETGRRMRRFGTDVQLLAVYLITSPHANMIGLYHLPVPYIVADTGLSEAQVRGGLVKLAGLHFAAYDEEEGWVWVEAAYHYQGANVGNEKTRTAGAIGQFTQAPASLARLFATRYGHPFDTLVDTLSPSLPHTQLLTETETETETETVTVTGAHARVTHFPPSLPRGPHRSHVSCGIACVPAFLHDEFLRALNRPADQREAAADELFAAYRAHMDAWEQTGQPVGDINKFWRNWFAATYPGPKAKDVAVAGERKRQAEFFASQV